MKKQKAPKINMIQKLYEEDKLRTSDFYNEVTNLLKKLLYDELIKKGYFKNGIQQTTYTKEDLHDCYTYVMGKVLGTTTKSFINPKTGLMEPNKYDPNRVGRNGKKATLATYISLWTKGYCSTIRRIQNKNQKNNACVIDSIDPITHNCNNSNNFIDANFYNIIDNNIDLQLFIGTSVDMEIKYSDLSKNLVLLFMICEELKLDFTQLQPLSLKYGEDFWRIMYFLYPAIKMTELRFERLSNSAISIYSKLKGVDTVLKQKEELFYNYLKLFVNNYFVSSNTLLTIDQVNSVLKNTNTKLTLRDYKGILKKDSDILDLKNNLKSVSSICFSKDEDTVFNKTSFYNYILKEKQSKNPEVSKKQLVEETLELLRKNLHAEKEKNQKD